MDVDQLRQSDWFRELAHQVELDYQRIQAVDEGHRPALEAEQKRLNDEIAGWAQSLSKRDLDPRVRSILEQKTQDAVERLNEIETVLSEEVAHEQVLRSLIDPAAIASRLDRLDSVLASGNASLLNLELSLNIDRIDCFPDGKVVVRSCRLGPLAESADLLKTPDDDGILDGPTAEKSRQPGRILPRRRAKLRTADAEDSGRELEAAAEFAADPDRFSGLDERWFREDVFHVPGKKKSWVEANAVAVARLRMQKWTMAKLADHFGRTTRTISTALRHANDLEEFAGKLPTKVERGRWEDQHAAEVAELRAKEWSTRQIATHFGVSEPTVLKADRAFAEQASDRDTSGNRDAAGDDDS